MEKFTVDIDKVLDDFEFNEDRALEIPTTTCLNELTEQYITTTTTTRSITGTECNDATTADAAAADDDTPTPNENFTTEMLKICLFNNNNNNNDNKQKPIVLIPSIKKNSVSNVFNSLQEYINTDVNTTEHLFTLPSANVDNQSNCDVNDCTDVVVDAKSTDIETISIDNQVPKPIKFDEIDVIVNETDLNDYLNDIDDADNDKQLENKQLIDENDECIQNTTLCRPNSLDIVSNFDNETDCKLTESFGETPVNKLTDSFNDNDNDDDVDVDFSPSTSEVSSVENQDDCLIDDECDTEQQQKVDDEQKQQVEQEQPQNVVPSSSSSQYDNHSTLGKRPPYWIPDTDTNFCMHCGFKFNVLKRRHHCRACGMVLCSKCCNMKAKLEYLGNIVSRVCVQCYEILTKDLNNTNSAGGGGVSSNNQDNTSSDSATNSPAHLTNNNNNNNNNMNNNNHNNNNNVSGSVQPNPNNPMEYCSTVPPLKQIENQRPRSPPTVMVPVGVLKRQGSNKGRSEKTVIFSDGIRPGCDLTELDDSWETRPVRRQNKRLPTPTAQTMPKMNRNLPVLDPATQSYIPAGDNCLPPTVNFAKPDNTYTECSNNESVVEMLRNETLVFAIQRNFNVYVKIVNLDCCVNKQVWCFSTKGLISVGQDEIVILLEVLPNENTVPKDVFWHLNSIYIDASKGNTITEMGFSIVNNTNFLNSKNHAGFLYVRPTYQCLQNIILAEPPYLFGILIHRWETPWVKIFPLRLLLRLGAEYRYYPCPIISTRNRESVFVEIGHTIINLLADFRNYSYTLPNVRGLLIHMEDKKTSILIPKNRYDQVMKALNNSSDHILAFAGNFSTDADSHLVCIQDTNGTNDNGYSTHAINIQNKPRQITGASFIILNGALKTSSGLTAKSSIIEDGLMIHILPDQMVKLRDSLRQMKPFQISCGCVNTETDEYVHIVWTDNDVHFNIGVKSPIDGRLMDGVPSIRVHNGVDHVGSHKFIRWTEVFILQNGEETSKSQDPIDISKLSENISHATCSALIKYLELLASNNLVKLGVRVHLHSDDDTVSYYEAGSNHTKLAPIYMNVLDNALIPVLHNIATTKSIIGNQPIVLELIFHILNS